VVIGLGSLDLTRRGDTLILQWRNGHWLGVLFFGASLSCLLWWIPHKSILELNFWSGIFLILVVASAVLIFVVPRRVETTFDLSKRQLTHQLSIAYGLFKRSRVISFDKIENLKVSRENNEGGYYFEARIVLKNGESRILGQASVSTNMLGQASLSFNRCSMLIRDVCAATGLRMLDV
jgi:hypothetical protein